MKNKLTQRAFRTCLSQSLEASIGMGSFLSSREHPGPGDRQRWASILLSLQSMEHESTWISSNWRRISSPKSRSCWPAPFLTLFLNANRGQLCACSSWSSLKSVPYMEPNLPPQLTLWDPSGIGVHHLMENVIEPFVYWIQSLLLLCCVNMF